MKLTVKLSTKIASGMMVFLMCAMGLGGVSIYTLNGLNLKMVSRDSIEGMITTAVGAQQDSLNWLAHREELSMGKLKTEKNNPKYKYLQKKKFLKKSIEEIRSSSKDPNIINAVDKLSVSYNQFDREFEKFLHLFGEGTKIVNELRDISVQILGKALSLQKSIERSAKKVNKKVTKLEKQMNSADEAIDYKVIANELARLMQKTKLISEKRKAATILLNKPLGFQEMAKDFMLYKDDKSGSGLIVDIEKLLGIDKDATMGASYPQLEPLFDGKREKRLFKGIVALTNQYYEKFKIYYELSNKMNVSMTGMEKSRNSLQQLGADLRKEQVYQYNKLENRSGTTVKIMTGVALLIGILLIILSRTSIIKPLRHIINEISFVSNGLSSGNRNLDYRINIEGEGELGQLSQAFNRLMEVLSADSKRVEEASEKAEREAKAAKDALEGLNEAQKEAEQARRKGILEVVAKLEKIVEGVTSAASDISNQVEESSSRVYEQQLSLEESTTAMSQMTESIQDIANGCSDAVVNVGKTTETANDGAMLTDKAVKAIFNVKEQSDELKDNLAEMNSLVGDISNIMGVVSDIADQTNLLALNAAIEAARAGEAGRGFAVVADEVRKLAEKTMSATNDVERMVKAIQGSSSKNVERMAVAAESVLHSTELAQEAGASLSEIVTLVEKVTSQVQNISTATEEQSVSADQIDRSSKDINEMAQATTESMQKSKVASDHLSGLANDLKILIEGLEKDSTEQV